MPRAIDFRQPTPDYDPTRSGTEFHIADLFKNLEDLIKSILDGALENISNLLITALEDFFGIDLSALRSLLDTLHLDFSSPAAFFASIIEALFLLPEILITLVTGLIESLLSLDASELLNTFLTEIVTLLASLPELLGSLLEALIRLLKDFTGVDLSVFLPLFSELDFSDPISFFISLAHALLTAGSILLGPDSPLNSLNLFNLVPVDILSHLPMSNIGEFITNMITDGNFMDAGSLSLIPGWIHDLTGGFGGKGAMFTDATGTVKELFGNLIPVSEGQIVPISGMAKWSGLAGTGNPIQLAITGYKGGVAMVQQVIASHSVIPPTTDWLTMTGEFTVPAGIDSLRTRLVVGSGATAGNVGFSNLSATKVGAMLQRLIRGTNVGEFLPDDIGHLFTGIISNTVEILDRALQGDLQGVIDAIAGDVGSTIAHVEERIESFLDDFSPLNGDNIFGSIADQFIPGIQLINDNLVNNLVSLPGTGFSHLQVGQALRTQATTITTMSSQLAQVTNQLLTLGVNIIDDFGRLSNTGLGADWLTSLLNSNGRIATPGGKSAEWITGGNVTNEFLSIFNGAVSKTQGLTQQVMAVLSGQASQLGKTNPLFGFNDLWVRVSDATTSLTNVTGTRVRFGGDGSLRIDNFINGALATPIAGAPARTITPPGPGTIIGAVAGAFGDKQTFGALIGNTMVLLGTAPASTPASSTTQRSAMGGRATGAAGAPGYPTTQAPPAPVFQYTAMDGAPGAPG